MEPPTLQAIDCILYTVPPRDFEEAAEHFETVLGLDRIWERDDQVGYKLDQDPNSVTEVVLSTDTDIPDGLVHYLVEDVECATEYYTNHGYEVVAGPTDVGVGSVATVRNGWNHEFELMDFD